MGRDSGKTFPVIPKISQIFPSLLNAKIKVALCAIKSTGHRHFSVTHRENIREN